MCLKNGFYFLNHVNKLFNAYVKPTQLNKPVKYCIIAGIRDFISSVEYNLEKIKITIIKDKDKQRATIIFIIFKTIFILDFLGFTLLR